MVASKVRWDERQRLMAVQEEKARSDVQEVDDEVDQKLDSGLRMDCKENVEVFGGQRRALKVSTQELKEKVMSPDESNVSVLRIEKETTNEKVVSDFQRRSKRGLHRQCGEMGGAPERVGCAGGVPWRSGRKWSNQTRDKKF